MQICADRVLTATLLPTDRLPAETSTADVLAPFAASRTSMGPPLPSTFPVIFSPSIQSIQIFYMFQFSATSSNSEEKKLPV